MADITCRRCKEVIGKGGSVPICPRCGADSRLTGIQGADSHPIALPQKKARIEFNLEGIYEHQLEDVLKEVDSMENLTLRRRAHLSSIEVKSILAWFAIEVTKTFVINGGVKILSATIKNFLDIERSHDSSPIEMKIEYYDFRGNKGNINIHQGESQEVIEQKIGHMVSDK
ncbi:hypothetical protein J4410_05650 [Candidatus Woesearchaeota archaeon]|nr:hypothetical protein [Candidatus Woesearchaeota archaeon]HLC70679.1 hypothetical protein [Candidatus Nanoarchaeia archaeon]